MTNDELRQLCTDTLEAYREAIESGELIDEVYLAEGCLALLDEIERLREALQKIKKGKGTFDRDPWQHCINTVEELRSIARVALLPKQERGDE